MMVALSLAAMIATAFGSVGECPMPTSDGGGDGACHFPDGSVAESLEPYTAGESTAIRCLRETRVTTAAGKLEQVTVELGAYGVPFNFAAAGYDLSQVAIKSDWWSKRPKTGTVSMLQNGVWSPAKPYTVSHDNTNCGDQKTCFGDCKCSCCGDGSMGTSYNVVAQRSISLYRGVTQLRITFATTLSGNGGFIYNGLYVTTAAALGGGQSTTETENEAAAAIDVSEPCKNEIDRDATIRVGPELSQYGSPTGFGPLAAGHGASRGTHVTYGPELTFGAVLGAALDTKPEFHDFDAALDVEGTSTHLLKVSMGGSSLGDHWRTGGPLYSRLVAEAQAALVSTGAELGGILWFQGFNDQFQDAYCDDLSGQYETNLRNFIGDIRGSLGAAALPVVVVKARNGGASMDDIQQAQEAVANIPKVAVVRSADTSECYHYDSGSQLVIGERAAKAMLDLLD